MKNIYFESQKKFTSQCGTCAINNFLGKRAYKKQSMQDICFRLSDKFINPHKHILGGDYDINVISMALLQKGFLLQWKKSSVSSQDLVYDNKIEGFLFNRRLDKVSYFKKFFNKSQRHWTSVKKYSNGQIYFFDSKIQNELRYQTKQFIQFLKVVEKQKDSIIFIITKDVSSKISNDFKKISIINQEKMEQLEQFLIQPNDKIKQV